MNKSIQKKPHQRCSIRKGVLKNFAKLTGKHLCPLLKNRRRRFPVNFGKFLGTPFLQNTSGRLLLSIFKYCEKICSGIINVSNAILIELLLYGSNKFSLEENYNNESFNKVHNKFKKLFWPFYLTVDIK